MSMTAKRLILVNARKFFERIPELNGVSWIEIIVAYSKNDHSREALI